MSKTCKSALVAVPLMVLALGCGNSAQSALKYNQDVAGISRQLASFGKGFVDDLGKHAAEPAKLEEIQANMVGQVAVLTESGRKLTPLTTTEGQQLHKAFLGYLDAYDDMVKNDFTKVIALIKQKNQVELQSVLNRIAKREQDSVDAVRQAQQVFAKANKIKLE